jgi:hypothetical protein
MTASVKYGGRADSGFVLIHPIGVLALIEQFAGTAGSGRAKIDLLKARLIGPGGI